MQLKVSSSETEAGLRDQLTSVQEQAQQQISQLSSQVSFSLSYHFMYMYVCLSLLPLYVCMSLSLNSYSHLTTGCDSCPPPAISLSLSDIVCILIQLQEKGETLQEKEREVMEVKSRLEGEIVDLQTQLNDKKKVQYCTICSLI